MNKFFILPLIAFAIVLISLPLVHNVYGESKISVEIISIEPISPEKWVVTWNVCALAEKVGQNYKISSDLEWESFHVNFKLYRNQCMDDVLGHPIKTIIDAKDTDSITITLNEITQAIGEQRIVITDVLSSKISGKYIAFFDVCTGANRLISPEIVIFSDIDERQAQVGSVIGSNSCLTHSAEIHADDINSIQVQFVSFVDKSQEGTNASIDEIAELEEQVEEQRHQIMVLNQEVSELNDSLEEKEETIEKKDAVIMEQIKVIQDLANMITKTIFESLSKIFQF